MHVVSVVFCIYRSQNRTDLRPAHKPTLNVLVRAHPLAGAVACAGLGAMSCRFYGRWLVVAWRSSLGGRLIAGARLESDASKTHATHDEWPSTAKKPLKRGGACEEADSVLDTRGAQWLRLTSGPDDFARCGSVVVEQLSAYDHSAGIAADPPPAEVEVGGAHHALVACRVVDAGHLL